MEGLPTLFQSTLSFLPTRQRQWNYTGRLLERSEFQISHERPEQFSLPRLKQAASLLIYGFQGYGRYLDWEPNREVLHPKEWTGAKHRGLTTDRLLIRAQST